MKIYTNLVLVACIIAAQGGPICTRCNKARGLNERNCNSQTIPGGNEVTCGDREICTIDVRCDGKNRVFWIKGCEAVSGITQNNTIICNNENTRCRYHCDGDYCNEFAPLALVPSLTCTEAEECSCDADAALQAASIITQPPFTGCTDQFTGGVLLSWLAQLKEAHCAGQDVCSIIRDLVDTCRYSYGVLVNADQICPPIPVPCGVPVTGSPYCQCQCTCDPPEECVTTPEPTTTTEEPTTTTTSTTTTTTTTTTQPPITECIGMVLDIILIVDSSASISTNNYDTVKQFIGSIIAAMDIGPQATRIGIFIFSTSAEEVVVLGDDIPKNNLIAIVDGLPHKQGTTNTHQVIEEVIFRFQQSRRPEAIPVALFMTDGRSNSRQLTALAMKEARLDAPDVTFIAIGVQNPSANDKIDTAELHLIAHGYGDNNVFVVEDFDALLVVFDSIARAACEESSQTDPPIPNGMAGEILFIPDNKEDTYENYFGVYEIQPGQDCATGINVYKHTTRLFFMYYVPGESISQTDHDFWALGDTACMATPPSAFLPISVAYDTSQPLTSAPGAAVWVNATTSANMNAISIVF